MAHAFRLGGAETWAYVYLHNGYGNFYTTSLRNNTITMYAVVYSLILRHKIYRPMQRRYIEIGCHHEFACYDRPNYIDILGYNIRFDVIIIKYNELSRWLKITNYFRIILLQTDRPTRFHAPQFCAWPRLAATVLNTSWTTACLDLLLTTIGPRLTKPIFSTWLRGSQSCREVVNLL